MTSGFRWAGRRLTIAATLVALAAVDASGNVAESGGLRLRRGLLSKPSTESAERIVRAYLQSGPPELGSVDPSSLHVERSTSPRAGGALVKLRQEHLGLPVIGGSVAVRVDAVGRVRWSASRARAMPPGLTAAPSLSAADAIARAAGGRSAGLDAAEHARLVWLAMPLAPVRLAWMVRLPADWSRREALRAFVDAETGAILRRENLLRHASPTANVFEISPVETPELTEVTLSTLPDGATRLENADLLATSCIDTDACEYSYGILLHVCSLSVLAETNVDGNFTDYTYDSDTAVADPFSEVQAFYHATTVYARARELGGFGSLLASPLQVVVNYRDSAFVRDGDCVGSVYTGNDGLPPVENAMFAPGGDLFFQNLGSDSIVFGQGAHTDWAYDGDVVYHEFGHAVMFTVAPDLVSEFVDEWGYNTMPGALHEGYADLMTVFVTDDPAIGSYAGTGAPPNQPIRDLTASTTRCPEDLTGEPHDDSRVITGAMWAAREAVADTPEAREAFFAALFTAQQAFGATETFESAAALSLAEIEVAMGADKAAEVEAILGNRLGPDCARRILDGAVTKDAMYLVGTWAAGTADHVPGPFQFRYTLDEWADEIRVEVGEVDAWFEDEEPVISVLLRADGEPIHWRYEVGDFKSEHDRIVRLWVDETDQSGLAVIPGPWAPGTYYLQISNLGLDFYAYDTRVTHVPGVEPTPDAGIGGGGDGGGCCSATRDAPSQRGTLLLFLCVAAVLRRGRLCFSAPSRRGSPWPRSSRK